MKVTIVGTGNVGLTTGIALAHIGHDVTCLDISKDKINILNTLKIPFVETNLEEYLKQNKDRLKFTLDESKAYKDTEIIFITVQTPEKENGDVELKYLYSACDKICLHLKKSVPIVIKSTVPVGTNEEIEKYMNKHLNENIQICTVSNPEFLSQGTALNDTLYASRIILGVENDLALKKLKKLYEPLLKPPYNVPLLITDRKSAEMVKYVSNSFLALKISFINEIANLASDLGTDIEKVVEGVGLDSRIGKQFLKAGIGYGGSCFPKDMKALLYQSNNKLKTIEAAIEVNNKQKMIFAKEIVEKFKNINNLKIAILGVTFKPNTDDISNSPAIENIEFFLKNNIDVHVFDPLGIDNIKNIFDNKIGYYNSIEECIRNKDIAIIFTELEEIKNFDISNYSKLMKTPIIYDGRNCYDLKQVSKYDVDYISIGRNRIMNRK